MRAMVVLPTPRVPVNRNAWCTRPLVERVHERAPHVLLADELGEFLRAPFARQRGVAHEPVLKPATVEAARTSLSSGTRHRRCRCCLPALTGFTTGRRGETDAGHHGPSTRLGGGEGGIRTHEHPLRMLLEFQSSAFDRSATSPINSLRELSRMSLSPRRPSRKRRRMIKHAGGGPHGGCGPGLQACGGGAGLATLKDGGLIEARVLARCAAAGPARSARGSLSAALVSRAVEPGRDLSAARTLVAVHGRAAAC